MTIFEPGFTKDLHKQGCKLIHVDVTTDSAAAKTKLRRRIVVVNTAFAGTQRPVATRT